MYFLADCGYLHFWVNSHLFYSPSILMLPHHVFGGDFCMLVRCTLILHTSFLFILNFHFVEYFLVDYKSKFIIGAQCNPL